MDDGPRPAVEAARAEHAGDVGREPADWDATLPKRRRAEWHGVGILLVGAGVVLPLVRVVEERPLLGWYLVLFGWGSALAVLTWRNQSSADRRGGRSRRVGRSASSTPFATT